MSKKKKKDVEEIEDSMEEILNDGEEIIEEGEEIIEEEILQEYDEEILEEAQEEFNSDVEEVIEGSEELMAGHDVVEEVEDEVEEIVSEVEDTVDETEGFTAGLEEEEDEVNVGELAPVSVPQDDRPFEERLTEFFTKHRKSKLKHIPALVEQYKGREEEVLEYLEYKYVTRVSAVVNRERVPSFRSRFYDPSSKRKAIGGSEKPKKKGSAGLIIILVIVVALVAAGFIFKDKIAAMMGGAVKEKVEDAMNSEEATNNDSEPAGEVKPDLSPEEQAKLDSMEAILDGETPTDDGNESDAETAVEAAGAAGLGK